MRCTRFESYLMCVFLFASALPALAQDVVEPDRPEAVELPVGTRVTVQTAVQVDTEMAKGQQIAVRLVDDVESDGHVVIRSGARGMARVVDVRGSELEQEMDEVSDIRVVFRLTTVRVDGRSVSFVSGPAGVSSSGGSVSQTGPGEVVRGSTGGIELRDDGTRLVIRSGTSVVFQLAEPATIPRP
jgi:hypothetical protein